MKHKHYDMIVAWANGQQIQIRETGGDWEDIDEPSWINGCQYRIKPEQEPVQIHCPSCLHSFAVVPVAKREWVGLTDGEIQHILDCGRGEFIAIQKAQQLLKDRNTTN
jgi:hypothetical protein